MEPETKQSKRVEIVSLFAIGILLLALPSFVDPIGSNPDTGLLDLGPTGTRWLLRGLGICFIAGGVVTLTRARDRS